MVLVLPRGFFANLRRNLHEGSAGRFHRQLDICGFEQRLHQHEGLARGLADGEQAVIAHDQRAVMTECLVDARAFTKIFGNAFIVLIADAIVETDCGLRHHPQATLQT
ncbi:MAG: hypothetical protein WBQ55_27770 [Xanthobacteraceae bacterium]